jgi:hypothetical protein
MRAISHHLPGLVDAESIAERGSRQASQVDDAAVPPLRAVYEIRKMPKPL